MPLLNWEVVSRDDPDYRTCLAVSAAAGAGIGSVTGLGAFSVPLAMGGAAWGLAAGYAACPYLLPAIRRKIEGVLPLSEFEVRSAADALGRYAHIADAKDSVKLLSLVRRAYALPARNTKPDGRPPSVLARHLPS